MIILHFHLQPQFKYELFHIYFTWLTMFETKTPVKEREKIIKCYKQRQTTKQQDRKQNKNKTKTQTNKGSKQTLKQDNKHAN